MAGMPKRRARRLERGLRRLERAGSVPYEEEAIAHGFRRSVVAEPYARLCPQEQLRRMTRNAPVVWISLGKLTATQPEVGREDVRPHVTNRRLVPVGATRGSGLIDLPVVVRYRDVYYIRDGHHRLTAARLRGESRARVRLVDLDARGCRP